LEPVEPVEPEPARLAARPAGTGRRLVIPLDVPVELGREEARRRVLEELDKAKYGGMPQWLEALLDRLFEWLRRIVEFVLEAGAGPRAVGGGINFGFLIILLVILAGIALVGWKVGLPRWGGRRPRGAGGERGADVGPEGCRAAAEQYAAAGDWRSAVRDRFRAVIKELENATVLDPRPARTAFEASALAGRALPDQARALRSGAEI